MPLPRTFDEIRNDPGWGNVPFPAQQKIRRDWVTAVSMASNKPKDKDFVASLEEEAYRDAPEWARPMKPVNETWEAVKGTAGEAIGYPLRLMRYPQQLVANLIRNPQEVSLRGAAKSITDPFVKSGEYFAGIRKPIRLTENEFLEPFAEVATDPLTYIGVGLAPRIRDIGRVKQMAETVKKGGKIVPSLTGRAQRRMVEEGVKAIPQAAMEIPKSWATFTPAQQGMYKMVMREGVQYFPKDELSRIAETVVNAGPEMQDVAVKILQGGDGNKLRTLKAWAEAADWTRGRLKGGGKIKSTAAPPKASPTAPVEQLNQPGSQADYIEKLLQEPEI